MKKLTIRLEDDLHKRLRIMSIEVVESLQDMTERLLRAELEKHERGGGEAKGECSTTLEG